ncbi:MAG: hypothetical protein WC400_00845 [Patescibacteria group bacterium]|jgi:hypothetical protein
MNKLIKPISLLLVALVIISGAGYWWFSRAPLASEFIAIIPDQAYIDWEADKLPTVDKNDDHIADTLLVAATNSTNPLPVLISLTYNDQAQTAVQQLEEILGDQSSAQFYPSASVMAATADLSTIRRVADLEGVVMVERDINVAGLASILAAYPIEVASPIQAAGVALIDGGTDYTTAQRELIIKPSGAGLDHGNIVAANLLQIDPAARIIDVAVLDEQAKAPISRVIEGVDWTIANKDEYNIATMNVSAGYTGAANFAFNRALSAAAVEGLAVVVSVANSAQAGQVAAKVPGMVRVGSYEVAQAASANYDKDRVDILAPADDAAEASVATAKLSGAVSQLIANSSSDQTDVSSTDWWTTLSTTVVNVDDVITLTDEQLSGIVGGDTAAINEFMQPLVKYLEEALGQLELGVDGSEDNQALIDLLGSAIDLTDLSLYSTDINLGTDQSMSDFWDELWEDLDE